MTQAFRNNLAIGIPVLEELVPPAKQVISGDEFEPRGKPYT